MNASVFFVFSVVIIVAILLLALFVFFGRRKSKLSAENSNSIRNARQFNGWQKTLIFVAVLVPSIIILPFLTAFLIFYGIILFTGDDGSGAGLIAIIGLPIGALFAIILSFVLFYFITSSDQNSSSPIIARHRYDIFGIASLACEGLAPLFFFYGFFSLDNLIIWSGLAVMLVLAGIVLGVIGLFQKNRRKTLSIGGLVLGVGICLILGVRSITSGSLNRLSISNLVSFITTPALARMTHDGDVSSVAFSPDGRYVVSGSFDDTARVWEGATGKEVARMAHDGFVVSVAFSPDGKYVISGNQGATTDEMGTAIVWEATTGREVARTTINNYNLSSVAFSPDGKWAAVAGCDQASDFTFCKKGIVRVWDITTGKEIAHMFHDDGVNSIAFSPDGTKIVSGSRDDTVRVWDAATGNELARMTHDAFANGLVWSVAFSPDGKWVASASVDRTARVWDATTGKEIARWTHGDTVKNVAFSPDGRYVISGGCEEWGEYDCARGSARVWEAATGREVASKTYDGFIDTATFSPDNKYVASGTGTGVTVWEIATGKEIVRLPGGLAVFSPDGKYIVLASGKKIGVWLFEPEGTPAPAASPSSAITRAPTSTFTPPPGATPQPSLTPTTPVLFNPHPDPSDQLDTFGVPMRLVPAGEFMMGSENPDDDAKPVHTVYLDDFYMDKYEVTNSLYKACVDAGVCEPPADTSSSTRSDYYGNSEFDNYPVIYLDWNQAKTYCQWRGARLPTEAEWEKAAGGSDGRTHPWGEGIDCDRANFRGCAGDTTAVGSYESGKSLYGLYDLAGNVYEWVTDWYSETYYENSPASNPLGPDTGEIRVLRGGSWFYSASSIRLRDRLDPIWANYDIGFRCSRPLP